MWREVGICDQNGWMLIQECRKVNEIQERFRQLMSMLHSDIGFRLHNFISFGSLLGFPVAKYHGFKDNMCFMKITGVS